MLNLIIKSTHQDHVYGNQITLIINSIVKKSMADVIQTYVGEVNKNVILFLHCLGMTMYRRKKKLTHFPLPHQRIQPFLWSNCRQYLDIKNPSVIADRYSVAILIH